MRVCRVGPGRMFPAGGPSSNRACGQLFYGRTRLTGRFHLQHTEPRRSTAASPPLRRARPRRWCCGWTRDDSFAFRYSAFCKSRIFCGVASLTAITDPFLLPVAHRLARPLGSSGITRLHNYYGPLRLLAWTPGLGSSPGAHRCGCDPLRARSPTVPHYALDGVPSLIPRQETQCPRMRLC